MNKVLVLPLVGLEESGLDLNCPLVIALKLHPDLSCRLKLRDTFELRKGDAGQKSITSLGVGLVLVNLDLTHTSRKDYVLSVLTYLPDRRSDAVEISTHPNLPIGIVRSIEPRSLAVPCRP